MIIATDTELFGAALVRELRGVGRLDVVTGRFDYAGMQKLKAADRQATGKLFLGCSYEVLQALKTLAPAEAARFLVHKHDAAGAAVGIGHVF